MKGLLLGLQVITGLLLIVAILLQNKGSGLSGVFGDTGTSYRTRRGAERGLLYLTMVLAAIFIILGAINFYRS